jgi:hypothetical protein
MIDHVLVKTTSALFNETVDFYEQALGPIGYKKLREIPNQACGFGDSSPDYWVSVGQKEGETAHVALSAKGLFAPSPIRAISLDEKRTNIGSKTNYLFEKIASLSGNFMTLL